MATNPTAFRGLKAMLGDKGKANWELTPDFNIQVFSLGRKNKTDYLYRKQGYTYSEAKEGSKNLDNEKDVEKVRLQYKFPSFTYFIDWLLANRTKLEWEIQFFEAKAAVHTQQYGDYPEEPAHTSLVLRYQNIVLLEVNDEDDYSNMKPRINQLRLRYDIRDLTNKDFAELKEKKQEQPQTQTNAAATATQLQPQANNRAEETKAAARKAACTKEFGAFQSGGRKRRRTHKRVKKNKKKTSRR